MKLELFIYWKQYTFQTRSEGQIDVHPFKLAYKNETLFLLGTQTVEIKDYVPPDQLQMIRHRVEVLREQKQELLAEQHLKVQAIDDALQSLLALPPAKEQA